MRSFPKYFVFFIFYFIINVPVFTQENTETLNRQDTIFVINSFIFNIDGYTRPWALINHGELIVGEELKGYPNLEKYIRDKQQLLINQRVLDSVKIDYSIGDAGEDGKYPVDLTIFVKDTWNIIAIPRPQYSSSTGFDLTLKARDYNFLGTMSPLRFDIGYRYDEQQRNFFEIMLDTNIPFMAFGLHWDFDFEMHVMLSNQFLCCMKVYRMQEGYRCGHRYYRGQRQELSCV